MATDTKQNNTQQLSGKLTNAQLELMKLFTLNLSSEEMKLLKKTLTSFVDEITQRQLDEYVGNGKYPLGQQLANEHLRIPLSGVQLSVATI